MQYRLLTTEELESFQNEFVQFLVVQGIDAPDWLRMKGDEPIKAVKVLEVFSDFIFDGIIKKVRYIDFFEPNSLKLFHCTEDNVHLINLESEVPFETLELMIDGLKSQFENFEIQQADKLYIPDRNTEIFRMIQAGGLVSDGYWFEYFNEAFIE